MAGAVTKKYYVNEFLAKIGSSNGNELVGKVSRGGKAFVGYHQLRLADKLFPVFICSVSPSSQTSAMLPLGIGENRDRLAKFLVKANAPSKQRQEVPDNFLIFTTVAFL